MFDVVIVGGGAAGFYAAIHIAEANSSLKIAILERGKTVLSKVKISGGGRCNVTHAQFVPKELIKSYPRGEKELLGPFYTHASSETVAFFESRGIALKVEADGRIFPKTDSSQTVIDCLLEETARLHIKIIKNSPVVGVEIHQEASSQGPKWVLRSLHRNYKAHKLLLATGSNPKVWEMLERMGHTIVPAVPSLFTFNIRDSRISGIQGLSTPVRIEVMPKQRFGNKLPTTLSSKNKEAKLESEGVLLITHWGISGPAVLRLSAWGARILNTMNYNFKVRINWLPDYHEGAVLRLLMEVKNIEAKKTILRTNAVDIPRRLWISLVKASGINEKTKWGDCTKNQLQNLADELTHSEFKVEGRSVFKEEFVTAGGIDLKEINFKTFESKIHKDLFFAGEIIDVDAITGGFNFQNAWTGAYIAAQAIAESP